MGSSNVYARCRLNGVIAMYTNTIRIGMHPNVNNSIRFVSGFMIINKEV